MNTLSSLVAQIRAAFQEAYSSAPNLIAYAPGRINLIGEHTDYNQGLCMPAGINRWVAAAFKLRTDGRVQVRSGNFDGFLQFKAGEQPELDFSWKKYVFGAIAIFNEHLSVEQGFDCYILGNVPIGSGVSSSAAIEVAVLNGLRATFGSNWTDLDLVLGCQQVEHRFLNLKSGMLDQYASQFSKAGKVLLLDFQSLSHELTDAEAPGWKWVVADTMVRRELAGASGYRDRVQETSEALAAIRAAKPEVGSFRDLHLSHLDSLGSLLHRQRLRHYITENDRVLQMAAALRAGNTGQMGALLYASHLSLRDDYAVSCPEADFLVETAMRLPGCAGARMMGGGFGGATLHLVNKEALKAFSEALQQAYLRAFNIETAPRAFELVGGAGIWA